MSHLAELEAWGASRGLLLRLQVSGPAALRGVRVGVARRGPEGGPQLLGDLKGWAIPTPDGLHLGTPRLPAPPGGPAQSPR